MEYKPKTVEIRLTKEEFEKLKAVRQLDRVVFLDESSKECFTVYNLASANSLSDIFLILSALVVVNLDEVISIVTSVISPSP
mgnify:CR=1 FL=1